MGETALHCTENGGEDEKSAKLQLPSGQTIELPVLVVRQEDLLQSFSMFSWLCFIQNWLAIRLSWLSQHSQQGRGSDTGRNSALQDASGARFIDIRKLQPTTGICTYDPGFTSTGACDSSITYIDGKKGTLLYRGCACCLPAARPCMPCLCAAACSKCPQHVLVACNTKKSMLELGKQPCCGVVFLPSAEVCAW